jgi:hypothetical protein
MKDTSKTNGSAYDSFLKECLPFICIEFNTGTYFNVNVLKNGKYKNKNGTSERLIYFANGLVTKYKISNQAERNNKVLTATSFKLKDIMPNVSCDVIQTTETGKKSVLALQYLNDIYKLTFTLFKDEIIAPLLKIPGSTKNKVFDYVNDSDQVLFKDKEYKKKNGEGIEDTIIEYTTLNLKLLGKPDNYLQTLITNTNETEEEDPIKDMIANDGRTINLDNIDEAFPAGVLISTWINMETVTYVSTGKALYWNFKCHKIDVDRRYIKPTYNNVNNDLHIRNLCKNNEKPEIFNIDKEGIDKHESKHDDDDDDDNDDCEENYDNN